MTGHEGGSRPSLAPAPPSALPLDSPRWPELAQAYGPAQDVPRLVEHLELVSDAERGEIWFGLWSLLCRQGSVYTASYAALPHLVGFAERRPLAERARSLHLVGAIEAGRLRPDAPPLPDSLAAAYHDALARVPGMIARSVGEAWDADTAQVLVSVLAIAKGHARLGMAALDLGPLVACPACGAAHAPAGWELGA